MILTDKFVFIHLPKTGGTFVRKVLTRIHEARGDQIVTISDFGDGRVTRKQYRSRKLLHLLRGGLNPAEFVLYRTPSPTGPNQHGGCHFIPAAHQDKPILVAVRNPYDRYVSNYEFGWWKKYPQQFWHDMDVVEAEFPHYPAISFEEFIHLSVDPRLKVSRQIAALPVPLGRYAWHFLRLMARRPPNDILDHMDAEYVSAGRYRDDLVEAHYLYTDQLNQTLYDFLRQMDYRPGEIEFILSEGRIMPKEGGRRPDQKWEKYYTPDLRRIIRDAEWVMFEMFPRFDI